MAPVRHEASIQCVLGMNLGCDVITEYERAYAGILSLVIDKF